MTENTRTNPQAAQPKPKSSPAQGNASTAPRTPQAQARAAAGGVGYAQGRQMLSPRASGPRDEAGQEPVQDACEGSLFMYNRISDRIGSYNSLMDKWADLLCDAIDHAHERVTGVGSLKDSAFLQNVGSALFLGVVGTLPGPAKILPMLLRWNAGQPSSIPLATLISAGITGVAAGALATEASKHNEIIISNLALSTKAFEMKSSISVNHSNEIRALADLTHYLGQNPRKCTPAILQSAQELYNSVPVMSHGDGDTLSRAFEADLWRDWIAMRVTRVRYTGASGQFYSEDLQGISDETLKYLETHFPQIDVRKTTVKVREDTTSDTGFGGMANR